MKKKNRVEKNKQKLFLFGSISVCLILFLVFTVGNLWAQIFQKYYEKKFYEKQLSELKEEEEQLKVDVEKMQDDDYIARVSR